MIKKEEAKVDQNNNAGKKVESFGFDVKRIVREIYERGGVYFSNTEESERMPPAQATTIMLAAIESIVEYLDSGQEIVCNIEGKKYRLALIEVSK